MDLAANHTVSYSWAKSFQAIEEHRILSLAAFTVSSNTLLATPGHHQFWKFTREAQPRFRPLKHQRSFVQKYLECSPEKIVDKPVEKSPEKLS
jgi:hypothetical protein